MVELRGSVIQALASNPTCADQPAHPSPSQPSPQGPDHPCTHSSLDENENFPLETPPWLLPIMIHTKIANNTVLTVGSEKDHKRGCRTASTAPCS